MKLVTYSPLPAGTPRPGILLDDKRIVEAGAGFASMLGHHPRRRRGDGEAAARSPRSPARRRRTSRT